MDGKAAIDPRTVDFAALLVKTPDRWSHPLRAHPDDVDVVAEGLAETQTMGTKKTVGRPGGSPRPDRRHNAIVIVGLRGVGDQQQDKVRAGNDVVHLAAGAVGLGKAG